MRELSQARQQYLRNIWNLIDRDDYGRVRNRFRGSRERTIAKFIFRRYFSVWMSQAIIRTNIVKQFSN